MPSPVPLLPKKILAAFRPSAVLPRKAAEIAAEIVIQYVFDDDAVVGLNLLTKGKKRFEVAFVLVAGFDFNGGNIEKGMEPYIGAKMNPFAHIDREIITEQPSVAQMRCEKLKQSFFHGVCPLIEYSVKGAQMKKRKKLDLEQNHDEWMRAQKSAEADNRRKLLASLTPQARKFAQEEFAKLGLTQ